MRRLLVIAVLAALAACDSGPVVTPAPSVTLSVIASADGKGSFNDTLGTFQTAWGEPYRLDLSQGLRYRYPDSGGFAYEALLDGADLGGDRSDVYVFMVHRYNDGPDVGVVGLQARAPRVSRGAASATSEAVPSPPLPQVRLTGPNPVSDMRLFFIDGVGEKPAGPIEVAFYPLDDEYNLLPSQVSVWVDPARHTLRGGPVLRVGLHDLAAGVAGQPLYPRFRVAFAPSPALRPLLLWRESNSLSWTPDLRNGGAFEVGRYLTPLQEGFEARLYTLDLGQLMRTNP